MAAVAVFACSPVITRRNTPSRRALRTSSSWSAAKGSGPRCSARNVLARGVFGSKSPWPRPRPADPGPSTHSAIWHGLSQRSRPEFFVSISPALAVVRSASMRLFCDRPGPDCWASIRSAISLLIGVLLRKRRVCRTHLLCDGGLAPEVPGPGAAARFAVEISVCGSKSATSISFGTGQTSAGTRTPWPAGWRRSATGRAVCWVGWKGWASPCSGKPKWRP
jgi:hypothetical protein